MNLYSVFHGILGRMSDYYKVKNFLLEILGDYKITESNFVIYGFCLVKKSEGPSREKLDSRKVTVRPKESLNRKSIFFIDFGLLALFQVVQQFLEKVLLIEKVAHKKYLITSLV